MARTNPMAAALPEPEAVRKSSSWLALVAELTKARITVSVTLTAATGYIVAAGRLEWRMLVPLVGVELTEGELPLLFLLKLSDFQEDLPGSVIAFWSGNQGDSRNAARRPALALSWRSAAELQSIEKRILLEYGRRLDLPRIDTAAAKAIAWSFESAADSLAPTIEVRAGKGERVWNWTRMASTIAAPGDWAELRLLAVRDPLALGESFVSRLADTWVVTAAPEEQEVAWLFRSPSGVEHRVRAEYEGNYRWVVNFIPDELGPWRYHWNHRFTPKGFDSPWGAFDVVLEVMPRS